jgi:hypothetical protein
MKIELTDEEVATILVALDNYGEAKRIEWLDSRAPPDAPDMGDEELLDEAGSAEWCWQKVYTQSVEQFNNSVADAVGEGEQLNNSTSSSIDPFTLPTRTD